MYKNYGDRNFFEHSVLVDSDHSDSVFDIIRCEPYCDEENKYCCAALTVDIEDDWINRKAIMDFLGMDEKHFDPIEFAIGCTDYYDWGNFGAYDFDPRFNYQQMDRDDCLKVLDGNLIDYTDLEVNE